MVRSHEERRWLSEELKSYITEYTSVYEDQYRGVCRVEGLAQLEAPAAFQLACCRAAAQVMSLSVTINDLI